MNNVTATETIVKSDMTVKSRREIEGGTAGIVTFGMVTSKDRIYNLEYSYVYEDASNKCRLARCDVYELTIDPEDKDAAIQMAYGFYKEPMKYDDLPPAVQSEAVKIKLLVVYNPKAVIFPEAMGN